MLGGAVRADDLQLLVENIVHRDGAFVSPGAADGDYASATGQAADRFVEEIAADMYGGESDVTFKKGDFVRNDYVAYFKGYAGHQSRLAILGKPSADQQKGYALTLDIHRRTIERCTAGRTAGDIYQFVVDEFRKHGIEYPASLVGHSMGIRDKPIAPASPWQNSFAERLIGSIRRECVDHIIVLGEAHLRRILKSYAKYYNRVRTHRSLTKDAPVSRPVQQTGLISSRAILGGLHHHYARV